MQYWDASALVSLCVEEGDAATFRKAAGASLVTWSVSGVEIVSAIERRRREGKLTRAEHTAARAALSDLAAAWTEIAALGPVRDRAMRLVATHALRAADAVQPGAALGARGGRPRGPAFLRAGLPRSAHPAARAALSDLAAAWTEIAALGPVRDRAMRLVATHALRAADAMQLGAALVAVGDHPRGHAFVCADRRLRDAGRREGFD